MGKTFVEDERPCDSCVNVTRYGCVSWNCEYINRDEAIKAWREKHEIADRKTEPQSVTYNPTSVNNIWEKPTNPYVPNEQTEPTISKMEQVDEPQTCEECEHWNDTEDGCADRHGCKTEPQTDCAWR